MKDTLTLIAYLIAVLSIPVVVSLSIYYNQKQIIDRAVSTFRVYCTEKACYKITKIRKRTF